MIPQWKDIAVRINGVAQQARPEPETKSKRQERLFNERVLRRVTRVLEHLPNRVRTALNKGDASIVVLVTGADARFFQATAAYLEGYFRDKNVKTESTGYNFSVDVGSLVAAASRERG